MPAILAYFAPMLTWLFRRQLGRWIIGALIWMGLNITSIILIVDPLLQVVNGYMTGGSSPMDNEYWLILRNSLGMVNFDRAVLMVLTTWASTWAVKKSRIFLRKKGLKI